jgi:hypothetical protein
LKSLLVVVAFVLVMASISTVAADSVWTDKSTYQVGDTLTICISTNGGKIGLKLSGPYTINVNIGNMPSGTTCFPIETLEQRDIGQWTITMYVDVPIPAIVLPGSAQAYFTVVPSVPEFAYPPLILAVALVGGFLSIREFNHRRLRDSK